MGKYKPTEKKLRKNQKELARRKKCDFDLKKIAIRFFFFPFIFLKI
jgi:hypothetical protein